MEDDTNNTTNGRSVEFETPPDPDENKYKKETKKLPTWTAFLILFYLISVFLVVVLMDRRLPTALTVSDIPENPDSFIEERSRRTLQALTSIGARPAGSYENEVLAVDLIKRELKSIKERTHASHKLSIDIQVKTIFYDLLCRITTRLLKTQFASHVLQYLEASGQFQSAVC